MTHAIGLLGVTSPLAIANRGGLLTPERRNPAFELRAAPLASSVHRQPMVQPVARDLGDEMRLSRWLLTFPFRFAWGLVRFLGSVLYHVPYVVIAPLGMKGKDKQPGGM